MTRAAQVMLDPQALRHNFQRVRQCAPRSRVLAVIKDNGYGHGMVATARALGEADGFAVACLEEALALRNSGIRKTIVMLSGYFGREELSVIADHDLTVVLHHRSQLQVLEASDPYAPIRLWIKLNTGMNRLGFRPAQLAEVWARLRASGKVNMESVVLMTHLASADDRQDPATLKQLEVFQGAVRGYDLPLSIANSAGVLGWPQCHADWVRPGLMLYGMSPFTDTLAADHDLRPVMTLRSRLIALQECRSGERIGYGGSWVCPDNMPVGIVAIGYGDGYPRGIGAGTTVLVNGHQVPVIGRVSMDMLAVDLRTHSDARVGDDVTLWGRGLAVEQIARAAGRIPYELTCGIAARVRRIEVRG
ncbi:MAG: alanine racemase [Gammaproteobacteria bacterium]|nr:alanine racemase [Gammaproteobacteria bacterium]